MAVINKKSYENYKVNANFIAILNNLHIMINVKNMDLEHLLMKHILVDGQQKQGSESVYILSDLQTLNWLMLLLFVICVELYLC